jgi:hypothetical protein
MTFLFRFLVWLMISCLLCWPIPIYLDTLLIGNPDIDVWNHAWGYWYVAQAFVEGGMPLETELVGAPNGGLLYYIDMMGATLAFPITYFWGPAVAYNCTLLIRISLAGLGAQYFCKEISRDGIHTWVAGLAYITSPFLLCELSNGISEVCAIQWLAWTFWALARVFTQNRWRDWIYLGIFQGCTTTATFYYGLTSAVIIIPIMLIWFVFRIIQGYRVIDWLMRACVCAGTGLLLLSPHAYFFWNSIHSDNRLIMRDTSLNAQLLRHNAVDPLIFVRPGEYQSVNLLQEYGEPFIHTGYLRWTVLLLILWIPLRKKQYHRWFFMGFCSLTIGLGSYLWIGGEWFLVQGKMLSLPFDWLIKILPQIAITHPLRLSIIGQLIFAVLAGVGMFYMQMRHRGVSYVAMLSVLLISEGFWGSSAQWPLPTSSAIVPELYENQFEGFVLDLPAEVGTTMKTSQYFWMQTRHQKPIPYTPDVRVGSARDHTLFQNFIGSDGISEEPRPLSKKAQNHLMQKYGLIVLHGDISPEMTAKYKNVFQSILGNPKREGDKLYWIVPKEKKKKSGFSNSSLSSPCEDVPRSLSKMAQIKGDAQKALAEQLGACFEDVSSQCLTQVLRKGVSSGELRLCLRAFQKHPQNGDISVLTQILQRQETPIRLLSAEVLRRRTLSEDEKRKIERFYREERIPSVRQELQYLLPSGAPK